MTQSPPAATAPLVDVIVACHNPSRPVNRAVRSIIDGNGQHARAVVVCHNRDISEIKAVIDQDLHPHIRFEHVADGIASPTGPFMHGITTSHATWVSIMGSDDELQPGAIAALLEHSDGADAVMVRIQRGGSTVPTPPVRPWGPRFKHPVRDRLFYRSAPLGLMRRAFLAEHSIALTPGLTNGGDLVLTQRLWTVGKVAVQRRGPGYVVHEDARDRVTMRLAPARAEMAHARATWTEHRLRDPRERQALAFKYMRIHVFSWALLRAEHNEWHADDREFMAELVNTLLAEAPDMLRVFSRADVHLIRLLRDPRTPNEQVAAAAQARRRFLSPQSLIPASLGCMLHREAPVRFFIASILTKANLA